MPTKPLKHEKYKKYKKTSRTFKAKEDWVPIKVPSLIDKTLFDKARAQMKANYDQLTRNKKNDYLLAGLIYCTCGRRRTAEGPMHGKHLYYRCTDRVYSHPLPPKCRERGVNARIADVLVWNEITRLMSDPKLLQQQIMRWTSKKHGNSEVSGESADQLKGEIEKIKKEEARYVKVFGAELITEEQLKDAMEDLRPKRIALERQVAYLESQRSSSDNIAIPSDAKIEEYANRAKEKLSSLSFDPKRAIIRKVVETIVADQKKLHVRGYLPIKEDQNVKFRSEGRDCWVAECGEVHFI